MKFNILARRLAPVAVISVCFLTGCQRSQIIDTDPIGFAAVTTLDERKARSLGARSVDENRISLASEWRERLKRNRASYRARFAERRESRLQKTTSYRLISGGKNYSDSIRNERLEERTNSWSRFLKQRKQTNHIAKENGSSVASKPVTPKGKYGKLIAKYAKHHGVPYNLARAVVQVESSFRANVTGGAGEIGLMQIKLSTARGMGYKGSRKQLYDPATNLFWGMKYLGKAHQLSGGTVCGTILRYNAGHYAKKINPISSRYCRKVRGILT